MRVNGWIALGTVAVLLLAVGCHGNEDGGLDEGRAIADLRSAYKAFNRGDIEEAAKTFSKDVEWIEPAEFPGGGTYHGKAAAMNYLRQSRARAAEVISDPEKFIVADHRVVVFVYARVLPKPDGAWQEIRLADVYTFRSDKVIAMRAFANRQEALRWAGATDTQP